MAEAAAFMEVAFPLRLGNGKNDRAASWKAFYFRSARGRRGNTRGRGAGTKQAREVTAVALLIPPLRTRTRLQQVAAAGRRIAVELWRISPEGASGKWIPLDDDNLAAAVKPVRDAVAKFLGVDDGNSQVLWLPKQMRGAWGVRVRITEVN